MEQNNVQSGQNTNEPMKYPLDIVSLGRRTKMFSVSASFSTEKEESPLKIFSKVSRLRLCVIENGKATTANMKIDQLPGIRARSEYAFIKYMDKQFGTPVAGTVEGVNTNRPAFNIHFMAGTLKGKTPADVLRENGMEKGKGILNGQYKWLKENLEKYPANQKIMDAIVDASKLAPDDLGVAEQSAPSQPITILPVIPKPIMSKKNASGMHQINELSIIWDNSRDMPVILQISNYWAPVVKRDDGTLNVQLSAKDKSTEQKSSFAMTVDEWFDVLREMEDCVLIYKQLNSGNAWKMALKAFFDNVNSYKNTSGTSGQKPA